MDYKRKPKVLFLDLETDSLDAQKAKIKFVGMMDESGQETMMEWNPENRKAFLDKINGYDKIVTFNGESYDLPILKNHGIEIPHWRAIDLYVLYKKKAALIQQGGFKFPQEVYLLNLKKILQVVKYLYLMQELIQIGIVKYGRRNTIW